MERRSQEGLMKLFLQIFLVVVYGTPNNRQQVMENLFIGLFGFNLPSQWPRGASTSSIGDHYVLWEGI